MNTPEYARTLYGPPYTGAFPKESSKAGVLVRVLQRSRTSRTDI